MAVFPQKNGTARPIQLLSNRRFALDDFEQQQEEDDGEDEADASSTVVAEPWPHAITTEAEHKDQNDQKDKHFYFLRTAKIRHLEV
jgi:hypothetical protein